EQRLLGEARSLPRVAQTDGDLARTSHDGRGGRTGGERELVGAHALGGGAEVDCDAVGCRRGGRAEGVHGGDPGNPQRAQGLRPRGEELLDVAVYAHDRVPRQPGERALEATLREAIALAPLGERGLDQGAGLGGDDDWALEG